MDTFQGERIIDALHEQNRLLGCIAKALEKIVDRPTIGVINPIHERLVAHYPDGRVEQV